MSDKWRIFISKKQAEDIISRGGGKIPDGVEIFDFSTNRSVVIASQKALDLAFGRAPA